MPSQLDPNTLAWIRRRAQAKVADQPPTTHQPPTDLAGYQGANVGLNALTRAAPAAPPENVGIPRQTADNFNDLPPIIGASEPTYPPPAPMSGSIPGERPTAAAVTEGPPPLEVRLARARNERALARGLDRIGTSLAGFAGVSPTKIRAAGTPGLDAQIEELEDTLTDTDRQFMAEYGIELPENMRLSRFNRLFPEARNVLNMKRLSEEAELNRQATSAQAGQRASQQLTRDIGAERTEIGRNVALRTLKQMAQAGQRVASLAALAANDNNAIAARAALVNATRSAGDVGVLTNQDLVRWEGRIGIPGLFTSAQQFYLGNLTPQQIKDLSQVAQEMSSKAGEQYAAELAGRKSSFAALHSDRLQEAGIDDARLGTMLGGGFSGSGTSPSAPGKIRVRNKATGQTGSISPQFFNPEKYDRL